MIEEKNHHFAIPSIIHDFRQALSMDTKTTGWMVAGEQNIHTDLT